MKVALSPSQEATRTWRPSLGACVKDGQTRFTVWAPDARHVEAVVEPLGGETISVPLNKRPDGVFEGRSDRAHPGDQYRYLVDGKGPFPDPASRFQPEGVHGPSEIVDPAAFEWSDADRRGVEQRDLVLYELHIGTFTPEGTFEGATGRLDTLRELGVTAVELLPVADFAGQRSWGYDGVDLFAPARCYGTPDDLRRFVDAAHGLGIAVSFDVVYNHFGPVGNDTLEFSRQYISDTSPTTTKTSASS